LTCKNREAQRRLRYRAKLGTGVVAEGWGGEVSPTLHARLDRLNDRQLRNLLYYLSGRYEGDKGFDERLRDGIEWLQGKDEE
jgi:hypothetical protein